jgi:hypothetical protein
LLVLDFGDEPGGVGVPGVDDYRTVQATRYRIVTPLPGPSAATQGVMQPPLPRL